METQNERKEREKKRKERKEKQRHATNKSFLSIQKEKKKKHVYICHFIRCNQLTKNQ